MADPRDYDKTAAARWKKSGVTFESVSSAWRDMQAERRQVEQELGIRIQDNDVIVFLRDPTT